jgi:hypothetical protein
MDFIGDGTGNDYKETREQGAAILREADEMPLDNQKISRIKALIFAALIRFSTGPTHGRTISQNNPFARR